MKTDYSHSALQAPVEPMILHSACFERKQPQDRSDVSSKTVSFAKKLLNIEWFPAESNKPLLSLHSSINAGQDTVCGVDTIIDSIRKMGAKAREGNGDKDAASKLFMVLVAAQIEMCSLSTAKPDLLRGAAEHSIAWVLPWSPFSGVRGWVSKLADTMGISKAISLYSKAKGNLGLPANAIAFKLLSFMVFVRQGIVREKYLKWESDCLKLDSLSELSLPDWWATGKKILPDMFPDLSMLIYGSEDAEWGDSVHRVGQSFYTLWSMFLGVEKAREASNANRQCKKHTK